MQDQCLQLLDLYEDYLAEIQDEWDHFCFVCKSPDWDCICEQIDVEVW